MLSLATSESKTSVYPRHCKGGQWGITVMNSRIGSCKAGIILNDAAGLDMKYY
jgi:hypothetical protein